MLFYKHNFVTPYHNCSITALTVSTALSGAAKANFDGSGARGLVVGCSMGAELDKHVYVCIHVI